MVRLNELDEESCPSPLVDAHPMLKAIFSAGGVLGLSRLPLCHVEVEDDCGCWDWLSQLRVTTTMGVVRANDPEDGGEERMGVMKAQHKSWTWTRMPNEQWDPMRDKPWRYMGSEPEIDLRVL